MWKEIFSYACAAGNALFYISIYRVFTRKQLPPVKVLIFLFVCTATLGSWPITLATFNLTNCLAKLIVVSGLAVVLFRASLVTAGCLLLTIQLAQTIGDALALLVLLLGYNYQLEQVHASIPSLLVVQLLRWLAIGLLLFSVSRYPTANWLPRSTTALTRFVLPGCLSLGTCLAIICLTSAPQLLYLSKRALVINCMATVYCSLITLTFIPVACALEAQIVTNRHLRSFSTSDEQHMQELRRFQHNYRNILHGLGGLIEHGDWDELKAYFTEVAAESKRIVSTPSNNSLRLVHHQALFGLLREKMQVAEDRGIALHLQIEQVVERLPQAATDLCVVLGIFLDNALEAAADAPSGWVKVHCYQNAAQQYIVISNNYLEAPTLARLYESGYSSKGPARGLGLPEAKRILRQYPAILHNTCLDNGIFTQELIFPLTV